MKRDSKFKQVDAVETTDVSEWANRADYMAGPGKYYAERIGLFRYTFGYSAPISLSDTDDLAGWAWITIHNVLATRRGALKFAKRHAREVAENWFFKTGTIA